MSGRGVKRALTRGVTTIYVCNIVSCCIRVAYNMQRGSPAAGQRACRACCIHATSPRLMPGIMVSGRFLGTREGGRVA